MGFLECVVSDKKRLIEWLAKMPDDAVIFRPATAISYVRASDKKHPNMLVRTENWFDKGSFQLTDDVRNLQSFHYVPIFWMDKETAEENLTQVTLDMAKAK